MELRSDVTKYICRCSERGALFIRQGLFTNECLLPACFFECKVGGGKKTPIISNLGPGYSIPMLA